MNEPSRREAHALLDLLFDHIENVDERKVVDWKSGGELQQLVRLHEPASLQNLAQIVLDNSIQLHHRAYMGHQVCPPFTSAILAELVISAMNNSTAVWEMSPFATIVEKEIIGWLAAAIGYPEEYAGGTAVSGGSAANLTALLAARARWRREHELSGKTPVVFCSKDAHYSVARAATIIGLHKSQVIEIPTDDRHRIDVDELAAALEATEGGDSIPLAIVATAGSTATGSFDPLNEIADLRDRYRTWLHVDAAHGASVVFSSALSHLVAGIERADSLSWDPHKMMWMPLSLGVVLVRDREMLRSAFEADAPYLFHRNAAEQNLGEMTIQCSRRADMLKLWMTLRTVGVTAIVEAMERVTAVTRHLFELVEASSDFVSVHEPQFNIFCFRFTGGAKADHAAIDDLNATIRQRLIESGKAWITSTVVKGRRCLRVTIINPRTTEDDVAKMLDEVRAIASPAVAATADGER